MKISPSHGRIRQIKRRLKEGVLMETELKLSPVAKVQAELVFSDPEIGPKLGARKQTSMETTYYDTEDGALSRMRWTLRLRREGGKSICTLKGPAEGLSRPETETDAESMEEGIAALLLRDELPEAVRAALRGTMVPTCGARFSRTEAVYDDGELSFVLSYDFGEYMNGSHRAPLCEMELELVSGGETRLLAFGEHLAAKHALPVSTESKHSRALALAEPPVRALSPFFAASELLNYCIRCGYVSFDIDEDNKVHYGLTRMGARELPARFGVDFTKGCAVPPEERS